MKKEWSNNADTVTVTGKFDLNELDPYYLKKVSKSNLQYYPDPQPIDVIREWDLNFNLGNVVKYVARAGKKDGNTKEQDLRKAIAYLEHELAAIK